VNGAFAQVVALTAHARVGRVDFALGGDSAYWRGHSTTKYEKALSFLHQGKLLYSPAEWMRILPSVSPKDIFIADDAITVSVGSDFEMWMGWSRRRARY